MQIDVLALEKTSCFTIEQIACFWMTLNVLWNPAWHTIFSYSLEGIINNYLFLFVLLAGIATTLRGKTNIITSLLKKKKKDIA